MINNHVTTPNTIKNIIGSKIMFFQNGVGFEIISVNCGETFIAAYINMITKTITIIHTIPFFPTISAKLPWVNVTTKTVTTIKIKKAATIGSNVFVKSIAFGTIANNKPTIAAMIKLTILFSPRIPVLDNRA